MRAWLAIYRAAPCGNRAFLSGKQEQRGLAGLQLEPAGIVEDLACGDEPAFSRRRSRRGDRDNQRIRVRKALAIAVIYVVVPVRLLEIQKGLVELAESPQGFFRFASVCSARPGRSDTRFRTE